MSLTPKSDEPAVHPDPVPAPSGPAWFRRLSSVLFIIFCFELGLFLLIYPWTEAWTQNYFSTAVPDQIEPAWRQLWNNPYLRGGVSGLGLVNVWVAVAEVFRMFSRRPDRND
ncbi:MAG TPA: hypothetical protein VHB50_02900 [Bryobacteraceae bacterium]|nr:hypothetical protein [Bryobacteraceae bacterium]